MCRLQSNLPPMASALTHRSEILLCITASTDVALANLIAVPWWLAQSRFTTLANWRSYCTDTYPLSQPTRTPTSANPHADLPAYVLVCMLNIHHTPIPCHQFTRSKALELEPPTNSARDRSCAWAPNRPGQPHTPRAPTSSMTRLPL